MSGLLRADSWNIPLQSGLCQSRGMSASGIGGLAQLRLLRTESPSKLFISPTQTAKDGGAFKEGGAAAGCEGFAAPGSPGMLLATRVGSPMAKLVRQRSGLSFLSLPGVDDGLGSPPMPGSPDVTSNLNRAAGLVAARPSRPGSSLAPSARAPHEGPQRRLNFLCAETEAPGSKPRTACGCSPTERHASGMLRTWSTISEYEVPEALADKRSDSDVGLKFSETDSGDSQTHSFQQACDNSDAVESAPTTPGPRLSNPLHTSPSDNCLAVIKMGPAKKQANSRLSASHPGAPHKQLSIEDSSCLPLLWRAGSASAGLPERKTRSYLAQSSTNIETHASGRLEGFHSSAASEKSLDDDRDVLKRARNEPPLSAANAALLSAGDDYSPVPSRLLPAYQNKGKIKRLSKSRLVSPELMAADSPCTLAGKPRSPAPHKLITLGNNGSDHEETLAKTLSVCSALSPPCQQHTPIPTSEDITPEQIQRSTRKRRFAASSPPTLSWKGNKLGRKKKVRDPCKHCGTLDTPQWRLGEDGERSLCNACGVRYRKQKRIEAMAK